MGNLAINSERRGMDPGRAVRRSAERPIGGAWWLCVAILFFTFSLSLFAQVTDSFESSQTQWKRVTTDGQVVTVTHHLDQQHAHHGRKSEYLELIAGQSTHIHYGYRTPSVRLIDELNPSVWIQANRNHIQLIATVVLPRTKDARTGQALKVHVYGDAYNNAGSWQRLSVRNIHSQLQRKIPSLRSQYGPEVDAGQAYISQLLLNVYSSPGRLKLWIDQFEMQTPRVSTPAVEQASYQRDGELQSRQFDENQSQIKIQESVLMVNGYPFMPKIIEHNGESLEFLHSLGFNTVALKQFPTGRQLEIAQRLGLKLIAPPNLTSDLSASANLSPILCWDLGGSLTSNQLPQLKEQVSQLHQLNSSKQRPLVGTIESGFDDVSRYTDICQLYWQPLFKNLSLQHSTQQLVQAIGEVRRGRNIWVTVASQIPPNVLHQQHALINSQPQQLSNKRLSTIVGYDQLSLSIHSALATGARGIQIQSLSRLDQTDADTLQRVRILQRINNELTTISPWVSGGVSEGEVQVSRDDITVYMTKTDRARLLWVFKNEPDQQIVSKPTDQQIVEFTISGIPVTYRPYHVNYSGIERLRGSRESSNTITLKRDASVSRIVLTADPLVRDYIQRKIYTHRESTLKLTYDLLQHELIRLQPLMKITPPQAATLEGLRIAYGQAETSLLKARKSLSTNEWDVAYQLLTQSEDRLRQLKQTAWNFTQGTRVTDTGNALTLGITSLPEFFVVEKQLQASKWSANLLPAGNMETLQQIQAAGWQHHRHSQHVVQSLVELTPHFPREGSSSLRLQAWTSGTDVTSGISSNPTIPSFLEAPVWITSPSVPVLRGDVLHIRGWVNISEPLQHHGDGLVIYDSIGGITMADRFHHTAGWKPFSLVRVAPEDGTVQLTFALMGLGEVSLDNVSIQKQIPHLSSQTPIQLNSSDSMFPTLAPTTR